MHITHGVIQKVFSERSDCVQHPSIRKNMFALLVPITTIRTTIVGAELAPIVPTTTIRTTIPNYKNCDISHIEHPRGDSKSFFRTVGRRSTPVCPEKKYVRASGSNQGQAQWQVNKEL